MQARLRIRVRGYGRIHAILLAFVMAMCHFRQASSAASFGTVHFRHLALMQLAMFMRYTCVHDVSSYAPAAETCSSCSLFEV